MPLNDHTVANFPNNASLSDRLQYWTDIKKNISNQSVIKKLLTEKSEIERSLSSAKFSKKRQSMMVLKALKSLAELIIENSGLENLLPEGFEALYEEEQILDAAQSPIVTTCIEKFNTIFKQWKEDDLLNKKWIEDLSSANYVMTIEDMEFFLNKYTTTEQKGEEVEEGEEQWKDEAQWENYSLAKKIRYCAFMKKRFGYGDKQRINLILNEAKNIFLVNMIAVGSTLTTLLELEPRLQPIRDKVASHAKIQMESEIRKLTNTNGRLASYGELSLGGFSQADLPSINIMISALEWLQSWNERRETKDFQEHQYFYSLIHYLNNFTLGDSASQFYADLLHIQQELETLLMLYWIEKFEGWTRKIEGMSSPEQQYRFDDSRRKEALNDMQEQLEFKGFLTWQKTQEEKPVQSDRFVRFKAAREAVSQKILDQNKAIIQARLESKEKSKQLREQLKRERPGLFPICVIERPEITKSPEPLPLTAEIVIREEKQAEEQNPEPVAEAAIDATVVFVVGQEVVAIPKPEDAVEAIEKVQELVGEIQEPVNDPNDPEERPPEVINNTPTPTPTPIPIPVPVPVSVSGATPVSSTPTASKRPEPCWNFILSIMAHKTTKVLAVTVLLLGAIGLICGGLATGGILPLTIIGITTLAAKIFFTGGMGVGMLAGGLTLFASKKARNHLDSFGDESSRPVRP